MIVAMQEGASDAQIQDVVEHLIRMGFSVHRTTGERQTVLAAVGARTDFDTRILEVLDGVEHVHRIPFYVEMAVRNSIYGRPGACYLDMPDDIILGEVEEDALRFPRRCADPPRIAKPAAVAE